MLAFTESNGLLKIINLMNRVSVEVNSAEHGMKKIDNLCLYNVEGSKGQAMLFDYERRVCLTCEFSVESLLKLKFALLNVFKLDLATKEKVSLMTLLSRNIVVVTDKFIYREMLESDVDGFNLGSNAKVSLRYPKPAVSIQPKPVTISLQLTHPPATPARYYECD